MMPLDDGLMHLSSSRSVADTMSLLERVVRDRGLRIMDRIDHAGEASKVGLTMPPTELLIFGNPIAGTPLMIASPTVAIDLPLKGLVWEDVAGRVWLTYNDPTHLQKRHEIPEALIKNISGITSICEEVVREQHEDESTNNHGGCCD
jgi:uncharacterized protein (DUF302 family)